MLSTQPSRGADAALKSGLGDLNTLLAKLERQVLSEQADPALRHSVFLRRKTGANVEYARTLLLRLEHDVSALKVASQRQQLSSDLRSKRDLIKLLNRHLVELDQLDTPSSSSDSSSDDEDDGPPPAAAAAAAAVDDTRPDPSAAPTPTTTLRARRRPPTDRNEPDTATAASGLFGARPPPPSATNTTNTSLQTRERVLGSQAAEQEAIKASLLDLSSALKRSNLSFARSLEEEREVLDRAAAGLDKNTLGMESAGRRMGTLRRLTEGQGWWGRVKLYAIIGILWLACFLLVFVGPKLRF